MKKRLLFLLLIVAVLGFFSPNAVFAQDGGPVTIKDISPDTFPSNTEVTAKVTGENFSEPFSAYFIDLNNVETFLEFEIVSGEEILLYIPPLEPHNYSLCLEFSAYKECREISASIQDVDVIDVAPNVIFNNVDTKITLKITQGPEISGFLLNGDEISITSLTKDVTNNLEQITLNIPAGDYEGAGFLTAVLTDGQLVPLNKSIEILGAINPSIEKIIPEKIFRYSDSQSTIITIKGTNLGYANEINWEPLISCVDLTSCENLAINDNEITINGSDAYRVFNQEVLPQGTIGFQDGTNLAIPEMKLRERILPWHFWSWVGAILFFVMLTMMWWIFTLSFSSNYKDHIENKTAPKYSHSLALVFIGLTLALFLGIIDWIIWGWGSLFTASIYFILSLALINLNFIFTITFNSLVKKFGDFIPSVIRMFFVIVILALTLVIPVMFTMSDGDTKVALPINIGLMIMSVVLGSLALEFTRRELDARKINEPPLDEIKNRIAEDLFKFGTLDATKTYSDLSRDSVVAAFSAFYSESTDMGIEFSNSNGTLQLIRHKKISKLDQIFTEIKNLDAIQFDTPHADRLEEVIRDEFGLASGKPLTSTGKSQFFRVYSMKPVGLESILPDPFPFIVYTKKQEISSPEMEELKILLNQIDAKARFAIVLTVSETERTRGQIRERFRKLGGDNVVVLGEKDCKSIVASATSIRLSIMNMIQNQVDLTIFKPYSDEGPTPVDMFYGRMREINSVLERVDDGSVAILGARRIGKTSMIQEIQRILEERGKAIYYMDCYDVFSYDTFLKRISLQWLSSETKAKKTMMPLKDSDDIKSWIYKLQEKEKGKRIVFILDEVDELIKYDQSQSRGEKLFRMFRSLAQEQVCQFIFSGERLILEQLSNSISPFFNFVASVKVGLLDKKTAAQIVVEPMQLVGTLLREEEKITSIIYEWTSGHPSLIQFVCLKSLEKLNETNSRELNDTIVSEIVSSTEFRDKYLETFWSQSSYFEKAISVLVAKSPEITQKSIYETLLKYGFDVSLEELQSGIRYLSLSHLLQVEKEKYSILPLKFTYYIFSLFTYETWLNESLMQWKKKKEMKDA